MTLYNEKFYSSRNDKTKYSASVILSIVKDIIPAFTSMIDLGCGVGTWLNTSLELGVKDIIGVEGNWVNRDLLMIPKDRFIEQDLSKNTQLALNKKYDLAISLEVAEHLPGSSSEAFVRLLTELSDFVMFSAATPFQGGKGHVNEQWPQYWINFFEKEGYTALDIIRKKIWNDTSIPHWYRKNILLYVKEEHIKDLNIGNAIDEHIAPEKYLISFHDLISPKIQPASYLLLSACKRRLLKNLRKVFG
jgi:hypothetical protein